MSHRRPRIVRNKGVIAAAQHRRMPAAGARLPFRADPFLRRVVRPLLIATLATSVSIALLVIVRIVSPEQSWLAVVPLCFLAALEGTYTAAWLNNPDSHGVDRGAYRAAEILLLVVLARVYSWIVFGQGIPSPEEMRLYLTAPLALLSTGGFMTTAAVTLIAWGLGVSMSRTFARLDASVYEINYYTLSPAEQKAQADDRPIQVARDQLLSEFLRLWLWLGMLMVVLAALSTFEVEQFATVTNPFEFTRLGLSAAMLFALMIYFLVGLWLLSHARMLRMNARWLMDGFAKGADLERGWQRGALILLAAIALFAAFLPIGSTLAISRILSIGVGGLAYLFGQVVMFLGYFFASAIMFLTRNIEETPAQPPELLPPPPVPPTPPPPGNADSFFGMMVSSAFWALFIALIVGAFFFFLRERGYRVEMSRVRSASTAAAAWWRDIWARLTGRARRLNRELRARIRVAGSEPAPPAPNSPPRPRFIRLGALSPREQVRYYYLALVRRAGDRGVRRRAGETPLEFEENLKEVWPDVEGDLEELTNAFLEARYSPQPIDKSAAGSVRERWQRVKARLRPRN